MAYLTTHTAPATDAFAKIRKAVAGFGQSIVRGLENHAMARSRFDRIERLNAKSDAELAAMGLTRDGIAKHVFRDLFYV